MNISKSIASSQSEIEIELSHPSSVRQLNEQLSEVAVENTEQLGQEFSNTIVDVSCVELPNEIYITSVS